jgi:hypothetical protein
MRLAAAMILIALALAPGAAAQEPSEIAASLRGDVVYDEAGRLSTTDEGKIRLRIVQESIGRIRVAVVEPETARRNGGVGTLASRITTELGQPGAVLVVSANDWFVNTTYPSGETLAGVRRAAERTEGRRLARRLLAAVNAIGEADPGPSQDASGGIGTPNVNVPAINIDTDGLEDAGRIAGIAIFFTALLPIALVVFLLWRRRRAAAGDLDDQRAELEEELLGVAETLHELDLDVEMPGVDPEGHEAYGRALELRDKAQVAIGRASTPRRLQRAKELTAEARAHADRARERLTAPRLPSG